RFSATRIFGVRASKYLASSGTFVESAQIRDRFMQQQPQLPSKFSSRLRELTRLRSVPAESRPATTSLPVGSESVSESLASAGGRQTAGHSLRGPAIPSRNPQARARYFYHVTLSGAARAEHQ